MGNTGNVTGSEVVQVYVTPSWTTKLAHPIRSLCGYAKAKDLKSIDVDVKMDNYVCPELLAHRDE